MVELEGETALAPRRGHRQPALLNAQGSERLPGRRWRGGERAQRLAGPDLPVGAEEPHLSLEQHHHLGLSVAIQVSRRRLPRSAPAAGRTGRASTRQRAPAEPGGGEETRRGIRRDAAASTATAPLRTRPASARPRSSATPAAARRRRAAPHRVHTRRLDQAPRAVSGAAHQRRRGAPLGRGRAASWLVSAAAPAEARRHETARATGASGRAAWPCRGPALRPPPPPRPAAGAEATSAVRPRASAGAHSRPRPGSSIRNRSGVASPGRRRLGGGRGARRGRSRPGPGRALRRAAPAGVHPHRLHAGRNVEVARRLALVRGAHEARARWAARPCRRSRRCPRLEWSSKPTHAVATRSGGVAAEPGVAVLVGGAGLARGGPAQLAHRHRRALLDHAAHQRGGEVRHRRGQRLLGRRLVLLEHRARDVGHPDQEDRARRTSRGSKRGVGVGHLQLDHLAGAQRQGEVVGHARSGCPPAGRSRSPPAGVSASMSRTETVFFDLVSACAQRHRPLEAALLVVLRLPHLAGLRVAHRLGRVVEHRRSAVNFWLCSAAA